MLLAPRQLAQVAPLSGGLPPMHLLDRQDGQFHELRPGRTTIGSSPKCTLRLERPGVQPLHCLIVHGPEGVSVRSWSGDVQLNGVPFAETAANVGDCLRIGAVELEIVERCAAPPPRGVAPISKSMPGGRVSAEQEQGSSHNHGTNETLQQERLAHETLLRQVADLQEENLQIAMERKSVSGTLAQTLAELSASREQLAEFNSKAMESQQLSALNQRLEVEVREAVARASELAREQAAAAQDHQKLLDEHAALWREHQQIREEHARLQEEVLEAAAESATYRGERDEARGEIERLQNELQKLAAENESHAVEHTTLQGELADVRRQNERMVAEATALIAESAAIADERTALAKERGELQQQVAALEAHITQLDTDYSVLAVAKLAAIEERDKLCQQNEQLQSQIAELDTANSSLTAVQASLSDEVARLASEQRRLDDLERQIAEERTGRENTSAELYRALLQLSEAEERDNRYAAAMSAHQSLTEEREQLVGEVGEQRKQIEQLNANRTAEETARQALVEETAMLQASQQKLADENSALQSRLTEIQEQLNQAQQDQIAKANAAAELERQLAAQQQSEHASQQKFANENSALQSRLAEVQELLNQAQQDQIAKANAAAELERQLAAQQQAEHASQQKLADENSALQSRLAEIQEQLNQAQQDQIAKANATAELERQLAAQQQQAESAAAAAVSELERQLADQARQFAESTDELERRLLTADNAHRLLGQARDEWREHCVQAQHESAKSTARIAELEDQVRAAEDSVRTLSQQVADLLAKKSESGRVEDAPSTPAMAAAPQELSAAAGDQPPSVESPDMTLAATTPEPVPAANWTTESTSPIEFPCSAEESGWGGMQESPWGLGTPSPNEAVDSWESPPVAESPLAKSPFADVCPSPKGRDADGWMTPTTEAVPCERILEPAGEWSPADGENPWCVAAEAVAAEKVAGSVETPANVAELDAPAWDSGATAEIRADNERAPLAELSRWEHGSAEEWPSREAAQVQAELPVEAPAARCHESLGQDVETHEQPIVAEESLEKVTADSDAVAATEPSVTVQDSAELVEQPATKTPPTSFIERYSHLFEEGAGENAAPVQLSPRADESAAAPRTIGFASGGVAAANDHDEEESIEQYMAKLMQRVRGESPTAEPAPPTTSRQPARPVANMVPNVGDAASPGTRAAANLVEGGLQDATASEGDLSTVAVVDWEAIARRAAAAPKADMGALRALANETARRAIGRHELKKHRRDAVTKIIVSLLAGVTSLWLMLDSPSWLDVQFLTACVSLVAAAYWAGGTFRELLESIRAAAYDGPEKPQSDAGSAPQETLPINVE